jgi:hypothetical protein
VIWSQFVGNTRQRYWGKADISQPTIPAESVENDPKATSFDMLLEAL